MNDRVQSAFLDRIADVPRLALGSWPTPVTVAAEYARARGWASLHVKREDLSHEICGGNKVRGLEFLLAAALQHDARTLLTWSVVGSHHVCRTAWHARQQGLDTIALVTAQPPAHYVGHNLAWGLACGTRYIPCNHVTLGPRLLWHLTVDRARYVTAGGTSPLSCLGHVLAAFELQQQVADGLVPEPDCLFVAMGSLGTVAGLTLGCALAGLSTRVVGVTVSFRWYCTPRRIVRLARATHRLMHTTSGRPAPAAPDLRVEVVHSALGSGYAHTTPESQNRAAEFEASTGIPLDTTYTAKALHGAEQFIEAHGLQDRHHLFWHTYHPLTTPADFDPACVPARLRRYLKLDQ